MTGLSSSINNFGESLFETVCSQALGMLVNGVEPGSKSYQQLLALAFTVGNSGKLLSLEDLNSQLQQLSRDITQSSDGTSLTVSDANSVWLEKQYVLQKQFTDALKTFFEAQVEQITTAQVVNSWVSKATRGKISSIIDDETLQQCTCLIINALYFKGLWKLPFKKAETGPVDFHLLKGSRKDVSMMHKTFKANNTDIQVARFLGAAAGGAQVPCIAVRLPYEGDEFAAVVAMPEGDLATGGTGSSLKLASGTDYGTALGSCRTALLKGLAGGPAPGLDWDAPGIEIKLWLPRFEIEYGTSLTRALQGLGITGPFQDGDITRIASAPDGSPIRDLLVSDVIHKVYIKVDEAGTEAAAVTAIMMMRAAMGRPMPSLILRFDRPFTFAVVHQKSNTALFVGQVMEPEGWTG